MEENAKKDKIVIDLFATLSKGEPAVKKLISDLAYISYAHNRSLGMTHDQLVRIGLGNDLMNGKYNAEQIASTGSGGKKWELTSVKCIITEDLLIYPKIDFHLPIKLSTHGTHVGDLPPEFWSELSTHDRDIVYSLTHPTTEQ